MSTQNTHSDDENSDFANVNKISDAETYGDKFCEIFHLYNSICNPKIDPSLHLMSLCTEHLIQFAKWVRETEDRIQSISDKLLKHDFLRPEVRNGIIHIMVYTFASIKAKNIGNADMFTTLQDHDTGLGHSPHHLHPSLTLSDDNRWFSIGIANKFSLRIYNDPYQYLSFLKASLSSLIDAGIVPENERVNQPKRIKQRYENKDELNAFTQIQAIVTSALNNGNNIFARAIVNHIVTFWNQGGKVVDNA